MNDIRGKVNKWVTNHDLKETNDDNDIQTAFIFQRNLHTNLNTCPTVPGNLRHKILVVAVWTTCTLLFPPRHRQESAPLKDVVLEDCLTWQAMFTVHGQHFFVDILRYHIFYPQKPHNTMLFYRGTRIQGRRHLVTAGPSLVTCIPIVARQNKTR